MDGPAAIASRPKPVIGRSPRHKNVFFAFGHDHLTMVGITGKPIADQTAGRPRSTRAVPPGPVLR